MYCIISLPCTRHAENISKNKKAQILNNLLPKCKTPSLCNAGAFFVGLFTYFAECFSDSCHPLIKSLQTIQSFQFCDTLSELFLKQHLLFLSVYMPLFSF